MDCHVAWMGGAVALGDFLYEALVGSPGGQRRQRILETPKRLISVAKESPADPRCDRLGSQKCHVCPESRSRDGRCGVVVIEVKGDGEGGSKGGEEDNKNVRHMDISSKCRAVSSCIPRSIAHAARWVRQRRPPMWAAELQ